MAFSRTALLKPIVVQSAERHTASLIFLHGSVGLRASQRLYTNLGVTLKSAATSRSPGSSGDGIKACLRAMLMKDFTFKHIRIIYPTAPLRPYSVNAGAVTCVWFDRLKISPAVPEHVETLEETCQTIGELVDQEELSGIPRNRIILGGFSMGAAASMYYGYQYGRTLAVIFVLSGFLNTESAVYETLRGNPGKTPPLHQGHGDMDEIVPIEWGKATSVRLASLGVKTSFQSYPIAHQMNRKEIDDLTKWVEATLPEKY